MLKNQNLIIKLERWFGVDITIKSEQIKNYRFTGVFENETIEQALNALKLSAPFEFTINQNKIEIFKNY